MKVKYIDLFAGVGGFRYGIERAGLLIRQGQTEKRDAITNTPQQSVEPTATGLFSARNQSNNISPRDSGQILDCVYSNEWDKYANSVYRRHYGECDDRDIRTVKSKEITDFDLLCGGFPCQSFSVAGKRGGFNDTRGTLFFEIARLAAEKQPRLLLLENVKGLLNHDQGRTFRTILATLDELGYDAQWQVLNSKDFGVPQNRERVYIVANLRGERRPKVFPLGSTNPKTLRQLNGQASQGFRVYDPNGVSTTLASQAGGLGAKTGLYAVKVDYENGKREIGLDEVDVANTITSYKGVNAANRNVVANDTKIRRLTPIECERLQGFPDNWTQFGADGELISDTQRYKMMGNAVTTNVIAAIVEGLL